jgi:hypothetical protein
MLGFKKLVTGIVMKRNILLSTLAAGMSIGSVIQAQSLSDWQFQVTPYAWLSGLEGTLGTFSNAPPVDVDISFSDILDDLDFGGMVMASARNGPWVVYLDATHVEVSTTERLGGVVFDSARVDSTTTNLALAVGRTVYQTTQASVDVYGGARAWWLDNSFRLNAVGGGASRVREKEDWISPLIGAAGYYTVSDKWRLFGTLDLGGFGIGADSEWSLLAGATYNINDRFAVSLGWRHLDVDYDSNGILYDVRQSGPVLGGTFRF